MAAKEIRMLIHAKQQNQPQRECLYAWYPEATIPSDNNSHLNPREIYIQNGLDKELLDDKSSTTNNLTNVHNNRNTNAELLQRYKQSVAPSERAYHSTETVDEALTPPWALHYQIQRRPATPNLPSDSKEMPHQEEPIRRLKSAPIIRSLPATTILTIPEPHFIPVTIPVPARPPSTTTTTTRPKTRASSAKARLNTTVPVQNTETRRNTKSAQAASNGKISNKDIQEIFERVYGKEIPQKPQAQQQPVQFIYTQAQQSPQPLPAPVYVYQRSATWCPEESKPKPPVRPTVEVSAIPLNPHYLHRPGVIAVNNIEKKSVVQESSSAKKTTKRHHHHHRRRYHSQGKRNEPLLAMTPIQTKSRLSLEIAGAKLAYDPKLTLDDKSSNLTKYFIDGRLYLIKDQRYNVIDNIDSSVIQNYNQTHNIHQRPKYYQTIPIEKFEIPKPAADIHYNASETYFYNTIPKRVPRYVVDPNFISEDINVNHMSVSKRTPTATVYA